MKSLQTLASTRDCAVVVLASCATKMHSDRGATLTPAINANLWEQGISTQIVLFRDWIAQKEGLSPVFLAGIQKLDGRIMRGFVEHVSALQVTKVRCGLLKPCDSHGYEPQILTLGSRRVSQALLTMQVSPFNMT